MLNTEGVDIELKDLCEDIHIGVTQDGTIEKNHSESWNDFEYTLPSTDELLYKTVKLTSEERSAVKKQHREAVINGDWTAAEELEKKLYGRVL